MPRRLTKTEYKNSPVRDLEEGIFNEAAQGRGGGHWAGTFVGLAYGLLAGAVIGLVPGFFIAGGFAALTWQGIAGAAVALGALGAIQGRTAGSENGSAAGAAVGSTKVLLNEIRQQFKGLKQEINQVKDRLDLPEVSPETPKGETPLELSIQNRGPYFKWKSALTAVVIGAAIGLLAYSASTLVGVNILADFLGKVGFTQAMAPLGAALMGAASGGLFGFNIPRITSALHMTSRQAINGRIFESEVTPELTKAPALAPAASLSTNEIAPDMQQTGANVEKLLKQRTENPSLWVRGAPTT